MKMKMKNGKIKNPTKDNWRKEIFNSMPEILDGVLLKDLFQNQIEFQSKITKIDKLPVDNYKWYSYHMLAMMEELGEVLKADKRWKTHRNKVYNPDEKLEEIADIFITLMNICIFSDVPSYKLIQAVLNKIDENNEKLNAKEE